MYSESYRPYRRRFEYCPDRHSDDGSYYDSHSDNYYWSSPPSAPASKDLGEIISDFLAEWDFNEYAWDDAAAKAGKDLGNFTGFQVENFPEPVQSLVDDLVSALADHTDFGKEFEKEYNKARK